MPELAFFSAMNLTRDYFKQSPFSKQGKLKFVVDRTSTENELYYQFRHFKN